MEDLETELARRLGEEAAHARPVEQFGSVVDGITRVRLAEHQRRRGWTVVMAAAAVIVLVGGLVVISHRDTPVPASSTPDGTRAPVTASSSPQAATTLIPEASSSVQEATIQVPELSSPEVTTILVPVDTSVAAVQPQYSFMNYSKDSQGNGQLSFHFTNPVDTKPVGAVDDMSTAPHGQISYTQQDPYNGVRMICGDRHFGLTDSTIDLLLPAEWFPTAVRADPHLSLSQGADQFIADGIFGKVIGCPASDGLLQVAIVLANNPTPDRVRVDAVRDVITVTVKR